MFRDIWRASRTWYAVFAMLVGSLALLNLLRRVTELGISPVVSDLIETYQKWIHEPLQWPFTALGLPAPLTATIDTTLLYLLLGGTVLISVMTLRHRAKSAGLFLPPTLTKAEDLGLTYLLFEWPAPAVGFLVTLAWPLALWPLVAYASKTNMRELKARVRQHTAKTRKQLRKIATDEQLSDLHGIANQGLQIMSAQPPLLDPRRELFVAVAGMILFVSGFLLLNLAGKAYGWF